MIERNITSATLDRMFDEIYNLISEASRIPLTDKVIIEESELASALDELKSMIPKEVRNADLVLEEQRSIVNKAYEEADRIVQQANSEAERIVALAEAEAERLIKQEEIVKEANALAEEIKTNALRHQEEVKAETKRYEEEVKAEADEFATATKLEALQYVDNMLEFFESNFNENLKTMATNRDSVLFEIQKITANLPKTTCVAEEDVTEEL